MELSTTLKRNAKALGVSEQYMIMADLIAIGYGDNDAFSIAFPEFAAMSVQSSNSKRESIVKTQKFKKLLADTKERLGKKLKEPFANEIELINEKDVAKEVLYSAYQQPIGSKERAELMTKYLAIKNGSEQGKETANSSIIFYLPQCCDKCPLMIEWKERNKKGGDA